MEGDFIEPPFALRRLLAPRGLLDFDAQLDDRIPPGSQTTDRADTPSTAHRLLQATTRRSQITQEPKGIQKIRLAGSVWPDEKQTVGNFDLDGRKVFPILQAEFPNFHVPPPDPQNFPAPPWLAST
jgi:hypothetical protein